MIERFGPDASGWRFGNELLSKKFPKKKWKANRIWGAVGSNIETLNYEKNSLPIPFPFLQLLQ